MRCSSLRLPNTGRIKKFFHRKSNKGIRANRRIFCLSSTMTSWRSQRKPLRVFMRFVVGRLMPMIFKTLWISIPKTMTFMGWKGFIRYARASGVKKIQLFCRRIFKRNVYRLIGLLRRCQPLRGKPPTTPWGKPPQPPFEGRTLRGKPPTTPLWSADAFGGRNYNLYYNLYLIRMRPPFNGGS